MVIKAILREWRDHIRQLRFKEKWRKNNPNNATVAGTIFPLQSVTVGDHTYGTLNVHYYKQPEEHLAIGAYCSVADGVHFFLGGEHNYKVFSSFPFKNRVTKNRIAESITRGPITIGDDVWIGSGATILSGTTIGQGAVIGAGSVVRGKIPPYAVYAGNRVIKYRFSEKICRKLQSFDFSRLNWERIEENFDLLYTDLTDENVDEILEHIVSLE